MDERNEIAVRPFLSTGNHPTALSAAMNLEAQHNEAMRKEIGYRIRMWLAGEQAGTPERLLQLIRQLRNMDHDAAGQDDFGPNALSARTDGWLRAVFLEEEQHLRERLRDEPNQYTRDEFERLLANIDDALNR